MESSNARYKVKHFYGDSETLHVQEWLDKTGKTIEDVEEATIRQLEDAEKLKNKESFKKPIEKIGNVGKFKSI